MKNLFINFWKFLKFAEQLLFKIMFLAVEKNGEQVPENASFDYLRIKGDNTLMRNFSLMDLPAVCDELEGVINYLKSATNLEYFLYDYPGMLEVRLTDNVLELQSLLREIKSVHMNILQQHQQQMLFFKEKISLKKTLKKLKENEIREMETVASLFDKTMFTHWEKIKSTRKPEVLEQFLSDVMSKQMALDNLNVLATRKLTILRKYPKGKCNYSTNNESNNNLSTTEISKIPVPPPLPPLPAWMTVNYTSCNLPALPENSSNFNNIIFTIESIDDELD
ncbi:uncharacterized protein LOC135164477 [Diachasmimorpha longicaudata]|uniref:uncharacterized protein LOC135164477 n=1 Tax=Diachasmimorpha longicaudata TaxID=58733 RepID=UPI0030B8C5E0